MPWYTKEISCKKCGQVYTLDVLVGHQYTTTEYYDQYYRQRQRENTVQVDAGGYVECQSQNAEGFYCDYCGNWNSSDDYE